MRVKTFIVEIFIILFFLFLTAWYFWPLITHFTSAIANDYDGLFITWSINHMAQNIPFVSPKLNAKAGLTSLNPERVFTGNIFYPYPYSLAYSDPFITAALIAKPFLTYFKEPLAAFNGNLILGQFLTLYFTYLLLNQLTKNKLLSVTLSTVFSFSAIHMHYLAHLHTFLIYLLPLSGFCLLKFIETKKPLWLYGWTISLIFQILNSFLPGYFILAFAITIFLSFPKSKQLIKSNLRHIIFCVFISLVTIFPFLNIYLYVSRYFNYVRPLTEVINFSLSPEEIFTKFFSPGLYLTSLIAIIALILYRKSRTKTSLLFFLLTFFSLILSLGPALHWFGKTVRLPFHYWQNINHVPLPYLIFYYLMPGFQALRTPSRWILLAAFAGITFSAIVINQHLKKDFKFSLIALIPFIILIILTINKPQNYILVPQISQYPPVYFWLQQQSGKIIIELPIYTWSSINAKNEVYRMLYSLQHNKTLVNGYSGYFPEEYNKLVGLMQSDFPNPTTLTKLKQLNIDYLIIHTNEYPEGFIDKIKSTRELKLISNFDQDYVYAWQK